MEIQVLEILGSISLNPKSVVFQRTLAIILELVFLVIIMVTWLLFCEYLTNETYNKFWEVISLFTLIPLYLFLIIFSMIIALYFRQKGGLIAGLFLGGVILSFILSIVNNSFNTWYFKGIFSLEDPIQIIQQQSIFANNIILLILSIFSLVVLFIMASRFTWLNITNKKDNPDA